MGTSKVEISGVQVKPIKVGGDPVEGWKVEMKSISIRAHSKAQLRLNFLNFKDNKTEEHVSKEGSEEGKRSR